MGKVIGKIYPKKETKKQKENKNPPENENKNEGTKNK